MHLLLHHIIVDSGAVLMILSLAVEEMYTFLHLQ
jgi:hypothetical protein